MPGSDPSVDFDYPEPSEIADYVRSHTDLPVKVESDDKSMTIWLKTSKHWRTEGDVMEAMNDALAEHGLDWRTAIDVYPNRMSFVAHMGGEPPFEYVLTWPPTEDNSEIQPENRPDNWPEPA